MSHFHAGTILKVEDNGKGVFTVTRPKEIQSKPPVEGNRIPIDFNWEVVGVTGYIDLDSGIISLTVSALTFELGTFTGSLKDGITIDVNVGLGKGSIKFYVEGTTLYLDVHISTFWGPSYDVDHFKVVGW